MLEIYLITGGISMLVLKSTKQPPLATITKYHPEGRSGFTFTKIITQVVLLKRTTGITEAYRVPPTPLAQSCNLIRPEFKLNQLPSLRSSLLQMFIPDTIMLSLTYSKCRCC